MFTPFFAAFRAMIFLSDVDFFMLTLILRCCYIFRHAAAAARFASLPDF